MLGSMVVDYLSREVNLKVSATLRSTSLLGQMRAVFHNVDFVSFRYEASQGMKAFDNLGAHDWIINAIGITKPLIKDDNASQIEDAVVVNSLLPHDLGRFAAQTSSRVLQIATDCVFSGTRGSYDENTVHDATDVYGKTKSLGESWQPGVHHLRCSIVGPEPKEFKFLIEWFRRQAIGASVNAFTNHSWNGLTTLHFAKLCHGIITQNIQLGHLQHVIPEGTISKARMLHDFAKTFRRPDIQIHDVAASTVVDRTLTTNHPELNQQLWRGAGYRDAPTVSEMIAELGEFEFRATGQAA